MKTRLQLDGATCSSCVYTIEHLGRKMDGVKDIFVDRASQEIELSYDGNEETVNKLMTIVSKIGYTASRIDT